MSRFQNEEHDILDADAPMEFRGRNINDLMVGASAAMVTNLLILKPLALPDLLSFAIMMGLGFGFVQLATWYRDNYPPYLVFHFFAWLRSGKYQVPMSDDTNLPLTISQEYIDQMERDAETRRAGGGRIRKR